MVRKLAHGQSSTEGARVASDPVPAEEVDPRLADLPRDPRDYLSSEERNDLAGALESIARTRREAEATSGDLQMC
jgi:hypothetical protein